MRPHLNEAARYPACMEDGRSCPWDRLPNRASENPRSTDPLGNPAPPFRHQGLLPRMRTATHPTGESLPARASLWQRTQEHSGHAGIEPHPDAMPSRPFPAPSRDSLRPALAMKTLARRTRAVERRVLCGSASGPRYMSLLLPVARPGWITASCRPSMTGGFRSYGGSSGNSNFLESIP